MPKVSVVLTSFNHEKYICEAIDSVLNQTFSDFELIIWDDASSDNSWHLIKQYSDPRIKAFRNEEQKRGVWGINKAISEIAMGEYIAIHHSDDVWELDKLEMQVDYLEAHEGIGAVFTNGLAIAEDGSSLTDEKNFYFNVFDQPDRSRHEWLSYFFNHGNVLCHPSVLIRKSCYEECGLYRFGFAQVGDFDMWIRLCLKYEIRILPEKLIRFRVFSNEANSSGNRLETRLRSTYEVYKLLDNYKNIASFDELVKIFPIAEKYYRKEGVDLCFILAMAALEGGGASFTKLFCQDLLLEAISDSKRAANIKLLYNFDYKSFIALTSQNDVFSLEGIYTIRSEMDECGRQIRNLEDLIKEMRGSRSWRITAPLRFLGSSIRKVPRVFFALPHIIRKGGGLRPTFHKTVTVIRQEGSAGLRLRLRRALVHQDPVSEIDAVSQSKLSIIPYYIDTELESVAVELSPDVSIAVHLHLYYTEMLKEFVSYLNNIPVEYDLYVSVPESCDSKTIQIELNTLLFKVKSVVVEPVPNQGRNISPFIIQFGERLSRYEIIAHLNSRKSHHNSKSAGWHEDILNILMGSPGSSGGRIAHIISLLQTAAMVVFSEEYNEFIKYRTGWSDNYAFTKYLLDKHAHLLVNDISVVDIQEASMFWVRSECLKDLFKSTLDYTDFPPEPVADNALDHVLERFIYIFASKDNGQCYRLCNGDSIRDYNYYEEQKNYSSSIVHSDIKVLSFYLPQFHPIPENDLWHGEGFTEWTKVRAATPLFDGHYQQHIPHIDIGYYLLDSPDVLRQQAEMMHLSGVHGQVFYHYWFSGKLILEEPVKLLLDNADIQMPFCFCWANENWTRRWDGNENDILLGQNYSAQDAHDFIRYLIPFFKDPRYIKVEDRPVLFIYRPSSIPDSQEYLDIWERECVTAGMKSPYVVAVLTRGATNPRDFGMDAGVERVLHDWTEGAVPEIKNTLHSYQSFNGSVLPYDKVVNYYMDQADEKDFTYFRSLVPVWDNTARYGTEAYLLHGSTPQRFQQWLESSISYTQLRLPPDRQFVLVNAWNEWAEGAHLEPDSRYGYSYLNSIGRALSGMHYALDFNTGCSIPAGTKVHLSFTSHVIDELQKDHVLKAQFIISLSRSSVFNACSVSLNASKLLEGLPVELRDDSDDADYILEFRQIALFDALVIEKMIQTACALGIPVIANSYDNSPLFEVSTNGSVNSYVAYKTAPLLVLPKNEEKFEYKNIRMRTDARCFVAYSNSQVFENLPTVTTIIRIHKSANINELKNALYCLSAMSDCVVIPLIAAQDLSDEQNIELERVLNGYFWVDGFKPIVHHYHASNGNGDLRSQMLNESLRKVTTRYASFLDYDDLMMPNAYSWLISRLNLTGKAVSFGRVYSTSYDGTTGLLLERNKIFVYGFSYDDFIVQNHAPIHSFMLDLEQLDLSNIVYFNDQRYMEDYYLTLQLFSRDNADWASLKEDAFIGDYIHSIDRSHTLAFSNEHERQAILEDPHYIVCEQRICDMRKSLAKSDSGHESVQSQEKIA